MIGKKINLDWYGNKVQCEILDKIQMFREFNGDSKYVGQGQHYIKKEYAAVTGYLSQIIIADKKELIGKIIEVLPKEIIKIVD